MWPHEQSRTTQATPSGTAYVQARVYPAGGTDRASVYAPATIPDGSSVRLVVAFHGTGGSDTTMEGDNQASTLNALMDAGYVVVCGQLGNDTWGNAEGEAHLSALYQWVASVWGVTGTVFYGQSQGGGASLVAARRRVIPTLKGWAGLAPAINYQWVSDQGSSSPAIRAAYGATDAASFEVLSRPFRPFAGAAADYAGLHLKAWASPGDTITPKNLNTDQLRPLGLTDLAASFESVMVTGEHLSPDHYRPAEVLAFYETAFTPQPVPSRDPGELIGTASAHVWTGTGWSRVAPQVWDGAAWRTASPQQYGPTV